MQVFQPSSTQEQVFEEISALTQSVLDGYNCCIFAYGSFGLDSWSPLLDSDTTTDILPLCRVTGQTGAGKSFTMEGGNVSPFVPSILSSRRVLVFLRPALEADCFLLFPFAKRRPPRAQE